MRHKFILFIIMVAVIAGIVGFWYYQRNIYSKEVLKLEILGPEQTSLAEEIEYLVKYKNNGKIRLEEPRLIFEYPKYSMVEGESLRITKELEAIYPGQEMTFSFKGRLLGKEGEAKTVKVWLSYRPKNLRARYESATTFTTIIKSVPLTFEFDLPSKIEAGKDLRFSLNYFSNLDYPLLNLRVQVEYPLDFEFKESTPQSLEKVEWDIPPLNKAEGGRIEILGRVSGKVGEQKIFKAKLGSWQEGELVILKETRKGIEMIQPSLYITQQINGNPEYIASPGDWLHYEISFKNIGEENLTNLFLISKLEGEAFDFQTLKSEKGEFEKGDNSIIFDWKRNPKLYFLEPKEEGKAEFWIKLKEELDFENKNQTVTNKIYLSQAQEEFTTKINSKLEISQKGYFEDEIFGNSGPLPPQVGQTTTYTLMWQVKNYYNDVKNVKAKATLPKNLKLTGKIFPEEAVEKFTFDSQSREIIWNIGNLIAGQGIFTPAPNLSFQIAFTPDLSQKGTAPEIISEVKVRGEDDWTKESLIATAPSIDTTLPDDQTIAEEMGIIQ